jgi:hypothetical protein
MNEQELIQSCERFLSLWHENERFEFERWHDRLNYDQYAPKTLKARKLWICLDRGSFNRSGVYMVRKADGQMFTIKAYGVPNLRRPCGHICDLITKFSLANVDRKTVDAQMLS